ncbi:MAG: class I SAM-dependent methyltransferase [Bacillota bacterium]
MKASNAVEWFSQHAEEFDSRYQDNKIFRERYEIWTKTISKFSDPSYKVLDIGCGSGVFSFFSAGLNSEVIGIDGSDEMINLCERRKAKLNIKNVSFLKADIYSLEKGPVGKVDLIICSSVLEYLDDLDASLKIIAALLKKNGVLIASLPNKSSIYRKMEPFLFKILGRPRYYKYVKNVLTLNKISLKVKESGFSLLESMYYAETPPVSKVFRNIGLARYSDNLILFAARQL